MARPRSPGSLEGQLVLGERKTQAWHCVALPRTLSNLILATPCEGRININLSFQRSQWRCREVKQFAQGHTAQSFAELGSEPLTPNPVLFLLGGGRQ